MTLNRAVAGRSQICGKRFALNLEQLCQRNLNCGLFKTEGQHRRFEFLATSFRSHYVGNSSQVETIYSYKMFCRSTGVIRRNILLRRWSPLRDSKLFNKLPLTVNWVFIDLFIIWNLVWDEMGSLPSAISPPLYPMSSNTWGKGASSSSCQCFSHILTWLWCLYLTFLKFLIAESMLNYTIPMLEGMV